MGALGHQLQPPWLQSHPHLRDGTTYRQVWPGQHLRSCALCHIASALVKADCTLKPVDGKDVVKEYISTYDERERDPIP